ncbi:MAG: dihydroorotate dehydrogenase electron transfer subunit [Candidatus Kariarchaeaceae archaeon]
MNTEGLGKPIIREIVKIVRETELTKTFYFEGDGLFAEPGQFYMLWLPEVDEKPISACIVDIEEGLIGLSIKKVGHFTSEIHERKIDEKIGVRGPFGKGFNYEKERKALLIAGGIGIAPIRSLFDYLKNQQEKIILIYGAQTVNELVFKEYFSRFNKDVTYCTDDGTFGYHGFPTNILRNYLEEEKKEDGEINYTVYGCGSELFLKAILDLIASIDQSLLSHTQLSLADRYMRCGVGLCGSCIIDDTGLSVCKDGPVFTGEILAKTTDFGIYGRNPDGSKNKIQPNN